MIKSFFFVKQYTKYCLKSYFITRFSFHDTIFTIDYNLYKLLIRIKYHGQVN